MLLEKEVISPGTYWYIDEKAGIPRKWEVTPETTKYMFDEGTKMLAANLPIPVPCEHDFQAHPMTPADKLKNNAGWVKEYRLKGDTLFSILDIQDEELAKKLPKTVRYTSPWINSFTDGDGRQWNNVIAHMALTTRPRVTKQAPFPSVGAAMAFALNAPAEVAKDGFTVSRAMRLVKKDNRLRPEYPMAFSLFSGIALADDDMPPIAKKKGGDNATSDMDGDSDGPPKKKKGGDDGKGGKDDKGGKGGDDGNSPSVDGGDGDGDTDDAGGFADKVGDVKMEELLCDLLGALGIHVEGAVGQSQFKRALYNAAMTKIYELTSKEQGGMGGAPDPMKPPPPTGMGGAKAPPSNPLIHQEQQPMYMSLQDIEKISDPTMKTIALSMYNENVKLRGELETNSKTTASLRDAKLKEENDRRANRVALLSRVSPRVKADLDAMLALPSMALSMGEGGAVVDPLAQTLAVLEKGLQDIPRMLTTPSDQVIAMDQPTDSDTLSEARIDELADNFARMMGCPPEQKRAG